MATLPALNFNPEYDFIKKEESIIIKNEFDSCLQNQEINQYNEGIQPLEVSTDRYMKETTCLEQKPFKIFSVRNRQHSSTKEQRHRVQGDFCTVSTFIKREDGIEDEVTGVKHSAELKHVLSLNESEHPTIIQNCEAEQRNIVCYVSEPGKPVPCEYFSTKRDGLKKSIISQGEKNFMCKICPYKSLQKSALKQHMQTHARERPFLCDFCDHRAFRKFDLVQHIRTHTGQKPFSCEMCDYSAAAKSTLLYHIRTHTGHRPFKCEQCDYSGVTKPTLIRHLQKHMGKKPHKCELCDYEAFEKSDLVKHNHTHTRLRPFKCGICDYSFSTKNHLLRHIQTHMGERPYKCEQCDYRALQKATLGKHIWTHTGVRPFKCEQCDYSAGTKTRLDRHKTKHMRKKVL